MDAAVTIEATYKEAKFLIQAPHFNSLLSQIQDFVPPELRLEILYRSFSLLTQADFEFVLLTHISKNSSEPLPLLIQEKLDSIPTNQSEIKESHSEGRSGWLMKRSELVKIWKKQFIWYCSKEFTLKWASTNTSNAEIRGWIDLRFFSFESVPETFEFVLTNPYRTYYFRAWDESEFKKWNFWLTELKDVKLKFSQHTWTSGMFYRAYNCCYCNHPIPRFSTQISCATCSKASHAKCVQNLLAQDAIPCQHISTCPCGPSGQDDFHPKQLTLLQAPVGTSPESPPTQTIESQSLCDVLAKEPNEHPLSSSWIMVGNAPLVMLGNLDENILIEEIFCHLKATELFTLAQVSKDMKRVSENPVLWNDLIHEEKLEQYLSPGIQNIKFYYQYFLHSQKCNFCKKGFLPCKDTGNMCDGHTGELKLQTTTEGFIPGVALQKVWSCCERIEGNLVCNKMHPHEMETPQHLQRNFLNSIGCNLQNVAVGGSLVLKIGVSPVLVSSIMAYHVLGGVVQLCKPKNILQLLGGTVVGTAKGLATVVVTTIGGIRDGYAFGSAGAGLVGIGAGVGAIPLPAVALGSALILATETFTLLFAGFTGLGFCWGCMIVGSQVVALPFQLYSGSKVSLLESDPFKYERGVVNTWEKRIIII